MNHASQSDATTRRRGALWRGLGVAATAAAVLISAAVPASAAELMRVTFVRHAQSQGNASGNIDTKTPGPDITALGEEQAKAVVGTLGVNNYDAIYASTMVRTQQTAAPMSQYLRLPVQVLPGLQEIEAGIFEDTPESQASQGYGLFPLAWAIAGDLDKRIPQSIDGHEFDARVDNALQTIYVNGDRNPVIFSHGGAIMFWTMMNVQNLTAAQKIDLLRTAPLSNTNYVVIEGNGEDGWTLVNWNGKEFSPEPTLGAEVKRQWRTLNRQLATSTQQFLASFATGDLGAIAKAFGKSVADAVYSIVKYSRAVFTKVVHEVKQAFERPAEATPANVSTLAATSATVETTAAAEPAQSEAVEDVTAVSARRSAAAPEVSDETVAEDVASSDDTITDDGKLDEDDDAVDTSEDVTDDDVTDEDVTEASDDDAAEDASADDEKSTDTAESGADNDDGGDDGGDDGDQGGDTQRDAA